VIEGSRFDCRQRPEQEQINRSPNVWTMRKRRSRKADYFLIEDWVVNIAHRLLDRYFVSFFLSPLSSCLFLSKHFNMHRRVRESLCVLLLIVGVCAMAHAEESVHLFLFQTTLSRC
jgi:hypothetical protein